MLHCGQLGAGHLPVLLAIVFTINIGVTYCINVWNGDVDPFLPYISALGNSRPISCLFSILLEICSFLCAVVIFLRYRLVDTFIRRSDNVIDSVNRIGLIFGLIGAMGMLVVANVQETALVAVHLTSALLCFGCGTIYMWIQSFITIKMYPLYNNKRIGLIRGSLSVVSTFAFITAFGFGFYAAHVYHLVHPELPTPRPWRRSVDHPGYEYHVVSAVAEWMTGISHILFLLSFARDFEAIRSGIFTECLVSHLDHSAPFE